MSQGYIPKSVNDICVALMQNGCLNTADMISYLTKCDEKFTKKEIATCLCKAINNFCNHSTSWLDMQNEILDNILGKSKHPRFALHKYIGEDCRIFRIHDTYMPNAYYHPVENFRDDTIIELRIYE